MKKKLLKIGAFILAALLIAGVVIFANGLIGNPISKALAQRAAQKYVAETYANTDYELGEVSYSFKDGYYYASVSSPSSIDTHFALAFNSFGKLRFDYFEDYVTSGFNTVRRVEDDYRKAAETVFNSRSFPYDAYIAYGELVYVSDEYKDAPEVPDYAIITSELTPDAYYNTSEMGARAGKLTVYIYDDTVTAARLAEILLDIRASFDEASLGFRAIDCVLEYTRAEDGSYEDGRVEVMDFAYGDIYKEGLTERVEKSNQAAKEYYAARDAEKFVENPN